MKIVHLIYGINGPYTVVKNLARKRKWSEFLYNSCLLVFYELNDKCGLVTATFKKIFKPIFSFIILPFIDFDIPFFLFLPDFRFSKFLASVASTRLRVHNLHLFFIF